MRLKRTCLNCERLLKGPAFNRFILNGTTHENHSDYPTVVRNHNGVLFLPNQLLERYALGFLPTEDPLKKREEKLVLIQSGPG